MTVLVMIGGAAVAAGILLVISGLSGRAHPEPSRPPSPLLSAACRWARRHTRRGAVAAGAAVLVLVGTGWLAAAAAAAAGCLTLPTVMSNRGITTRLNRLDAIEQWVRKLGALLGASQGLEEALKTSAERPPAAIADQVSGLARRLHGGMSIDAALYRFADELDDPVADLVAGALVQAAEVRGRGVQALLNDLAAMVADDVAGRRAVEAERAPHRTTVRGMAIIFVLFGVGLALRPDYSAAYHTLVGQLVLAAVLGVCGSALWVMYRLAHQTPVDRILTSPDRAQEPPL